MTDITMLPITRLSAMLDAGEITATALTRAFLAKATGSGRELNCFITLCADTAERQAAEATRRAAAGRRLGPLDGIPVGLKDNIDVQGVPTTNGFRGPLDFIPSADSEIVRRLRQAGAVLLGKLNMHEGALGATTDNAHHGRTINPHRAGHTPGGSSGGSGAAVAAGLCCAALGTDTGGSVRIPASYCGVVGLKPSYGLISTRGVVPLSRSLDHAGPLTRSVGDAALMLGVLAGFDPDCVESRPAPACRYDPPAAIRLDGLRLGVIGNFVSEAQEPDVVAGFEMALRQLGRLGATIVPVTLPHYDPLKGRRAGFVRVEAEAAFIHGPLYAKQPERFSAQMKLFLEYGLHLPSIKLLAADQAIATGAAELLACLRDVDAVVSPATPQAAPAFDGAAPDSAGSFSILANFAGVPAISVPMGRNALGLPLGLQVIGRMHDESRVLSIAAAYEASRGPA
jgi:aspartyl-tRNA(Asn)/glutamyl-tRNA(Gln) amidotransferase subunit A